MRKWRNCTFLHSSHVELECGTTPPVRDDSAWSHLMSAQLGRAETSGEVLNFSELEKFKKTESVTLGKDSRPDSKVVRDETRDDP